MRPQSPPTVLAPTLLARSRSWLRRRRFELGLTASLGVHLLLLAAFLATPHGSAVFGGADVRGSVREGGGQAIAVTLIRNVIAPQAASAGGASSPADRLAALLTRQLAAEPSPLVAQDHPSTKPGALDRLIQDADRAGRLSEVKTPQQPVSKTATVKAELEVTAGGRAPGRTSAGGPKGELFTALQPCWLKALGRSLTAVRLEVALDSRGYAVGSPKVMEVGPGDPDARRIALERSLQAVAACLPYRPSGGGDPSGSYEAVFGVSPN